jgi:hypothetical protein
LGILFSRYLFGKTSLLLIAISFIALLITQTTVLWLAYFLVLIYLLSENYRNNLSLKSIYALFFPAIIICVAYYDQLISILNEKIINSVPIKLNQINIALNALGQDFLFGRGLGSAFDNGAFSIEVVFLHILTTTGVIGLIIYCYMFFYWPIKGLRFYSSDQLIRIIFVGFLLVVFESFSNPYLLGANSGLFLIPIVAARFLQLDSLRLQAHD